MSNLNLTKNIFFSHSDFSEEDVKNLVKSSLKGIDIGELYLERTESESLSLENGRIRTSSFDISQGFGLRAVRDDKIAFAYSNLLNQKSLKSATESIKSTEEGIFKSVREEDGDLQNSLYIANNPLESFDFSQKVKLLEDIDIYAHKKDARVKQVMARLSGAWKAVHIIQPDGRQSADIRPMVSLSISVMMEQNGKRETGFYSFGGRLMYSDVYTENTWQSAVDEAIRQADVNLSSVSAPSGELPVILGSGWCGVLLHEAVGHGLEGDFNRKGSSAFSGCIGQKVASEQVTVIDDGTLPSRRGSLNIDDEGTPTQRTTLIENGILVNYMQDKLNARLMGTKSTGNGRRENYQSVPYPRMTNTFMPNGKYPTEELIESVDKGIYAVNFEGGQVDITSGQFVFSASEAYLIEKGKITSPLKNLSLIGDGKTVMNNVVMTGNDFALDAGSGTCGKEGQSVPVGVGQPSLKIAKMTVGGTL